jgi:hypothetical protein
VGQIKLQKGSLKQKKNGFRNTLISLNHKKQLPLLKVWFACAARSSLECSCFQMRTAKWQRAMYTLRCFDIKLKEKRKKKYQ